MPPPLPPLPPLALMVPSMLRLVMVPISRAPPPPPPSAPTDGVWLLDYRAGKLLGTVVDRAAGKIVGWAELDLVSEFNLPPRQNVHFLMTTGQISQGQSALYLAETSTGKFGVYTMGVRPEGKTSVFIRRHDFSPCRQPPVKQ